MAPKHHPTPLSGGDRKALAKELGKSRAMTSILAAQSADARAKGEALTRQADRLLCESWSERMWADGGQIDPSPKIDQAISGGHPWLEIECSRCKTRRDVDLAALRHPPTTFVHDWQAGSAVASAPRPIADRRRHCYSWRSTLARPLRRPDDVQLVFDHHQPGRHQRAVPRGQPVRR
jgi:hypothetical protein